MSAHANRRRGGEERAAEAVHSAMPEGAGPGRLLSIREVVRETSLHRATIYRLRRAGAFPAPIRIARGRVAWPEAEIERWKRDPLGWRAAAADGPG